MRRILLLLTSIVVALGMAAWGKRGQVEREQNNSTPEATVAALLDAVKEGDQTKVNQYVAQNDSMYSEESETDITQSKIMFENITYDIQSVDVIDTEGTAGVAVDITNIDMNIVMQQYMEKALEASENSTDMTEEEAMTLLKDSIAENKENTITKTVNLEVKKAEDGQWKVKTTDELNSILTGGLSEETFQ